MMDDPMTIIEEYLDLVRSHLPGEIAEEIISELRSYIVEAAQEIGQGNITTQSAKMAISKFGAPSVVAEEYRSSMLLKSLEAEEPHETKQQRLIIPLLKEIKRYEYLTLVRFLIWLVLFAVLVFLVSIVVSPGHYAFFDIFLEILIFAIFGLILIKLYFRSRRYLIKTFGHKSIFGRRLKVEIGVDALITFSLTVLMLNATVSLARDHTFYVHIVRDHFSYTLSGSPLIIFLFAYHVILILGLLIRGVADIYDLKTSDQESTLKSIIVSIAFLTIGIGMKIGIDVVLIAKSALLYSYNPVLVILVIFLALQIITSYMKLTEEKEIH
ncbi:MAG: hypothetical protein ACFFCW_12245 [Candidatus Hodarchaeota archaeon]